MTLTHEIASAKTTLRGMWYQQGTSFNCKKIWDWFHRSATQGPRWAMDLPKGHWSQQSCFKLIHSALLWCFTKKKKKKTLLHVVAWTCFKKKWCTCYHMVIQTFGLHRLTAALLLFLWGEVASWAPCFGWQPSCHKSEATASRITSASIGVLGSVL